MRVGISPYLAEVLARQREGLRGLGLLRELILWAPSMEWDSLYRGVMDPELGDWSEAWYAHDFSAGDSLTPGQYPSPMLETSRDTALDHLQTLWETYF